MPPSGTRRKPLINRLRISQLELVAAMNRTDTLSAAAREVNLTQPAASRLLRELASDLRVVLFERVGRTLQPTSAGRALIQRAVGVLAELDRTQDEIEAIHNGLIGTVHLGAGVSSCYVVVPTALKRLMEQSSEIAVSIREGAMDELLGRLRTGHIDLLVGRFGREQDLSDVQTEDLYRPNVVAVCGVKHPLASRRSLDWNQLYEQPWILPEAGTAMRSAIESQFRKTRRRPTKVLVESSSIQVNVALLNSSRLVWVLSSDVAMYFARLGTLHVLKVDQLPAPGAFVLARLNGRRLSPAAEKLGDCLRAAAKL